MSTDSRLRAVHLPPGRGLLSQEFVDEYKRERCAIALSEVVAEVGYHRLSVGAVVERAMVARATFYHLFEGRNGAFDWACAYASERLAGPIEEAAETSSPWPDRVTAVIAALLQTAETNRALAELCLVHAASRTNSDGPGEEVVDALEKVFEESGTPEGVGGEYRLLLAYGVIAVLRRRLLQRGSLSGLEDELATLALCSYAGR